MVNFQSRREDPHPETGYGSVIVKLRASVTSDQGKASIKLGTSLFRSNEYTSTWPCEGLLAGCLDASTTENSLAESFSCLPAYHGLVLLGVDRTFDPNELFADPVTGDESEESRCCTGSRDSSSLSRAGIDVSASRTGADRETKDVIVYVVIIDMFRVWGAISLYCSVGFIFHI